MQPLLLAVDFGASNIKAFRISGGQLFPVPLNRRQDDADHEPGVIYYKKLKNGGYEAIFGVLAQNRLSLDVVNFVHDIKRNLIHEDWRKFIPNLGKEINAVEAATEIFRRIIREAEPDDGQPVEVLLTVPVSFTATQVKRLRQAANDAGMKVRDILTEPFAAVFALENLKRDAIITVFDFGGSTLDISVVKLESDGDDVTVTELGAIGLRIGGLGIDEAIVNDLLPADVRAQFLADKHMLLLLYHIQNARETIYKENSTEQLVGAIDWELPRSDLEEMLRSDRFLGKIRRALDELFNDLQEGSEALDKSEVTDILPIGGLMQMPIFVEFLEDYFGADKFRASEFKYERSDIFHKDIESRYMAVAGGAARYLLLCEEDAAPMRATATLPFQLGFMADKEFVPCLPKNSPRSASFVSMHKLISPEQLAADDWKVRIFQSFASEDNPDPIFVDKFQLDQELYLPDQPVLVYMHLTSDGRLCLHTIQQQVFDEEDDSGMVNVETLYLKLEI